MGRILTVAAVGLMCALAAAPVAADSVDDLETRAQKEVDEATEMLSKVQTGQIAYKAAMAKMQEFMGHMEEFEAASESRAAKYIEDLQQSIYWTRKFTPLVVEPAAAPPPQAPGPAGAPAAPAPAGGAPAAPPPRKPRRELPPEEPTEAGFPAPKVPAGFTPPALPDQPWPRAAALVPLVAGNDKTVRLFACREAAAAPSKELVAAILELLRTTPDPELIEAASWALTHMRYDGVYIGFAKSCETWAEEPLDRLLAVMRELPEKRTVAALFTLAMRFVPSIGGADSMSQDAMDTYKQRARSAWGQGWRARVTNVWRSWPDPVVSAGLGEAWELRQKQNKLPEMQEVLLAAGAIGNARVVRHAVPFLTQGREENSPLRAPAKAAVEMVGKPAVPYLVTGLLSSTTKNWSVRSLQQITGVVLASQPKLWLQWWNDNR